MAYSLISPNEAITWTNAGLLSIVPLHGNKLKWNSVQDTKIFIQENTVEMLSENDGHFASALMSGEHDDVIKWKHFLPYWALGEENPSIAGGSPSQRPVTHSFDVFFICTWTKVWANNRNSDDMRRNRAHYDVTVMNKDRSGVINTVCPALWKDISLWQALPLWSLSLYMS